MAARVLIVAMPKGGCGKTATVVAFAWLLQRAGKRVLVVDLDPQGNASAALGARGGGYGTMELLLDPSLAFRPREVASGLHLVVASPWVAGLDLELQRVNQLTGPVVVREALARVAGSYDYILCDTSPYVGPVTYNAAAAGPILAPVEATRLAVSVLPELATVIGSLRRGVAPSAEVIAYLPTRYVSRQTESREALAALCRLAGKRVLRTRIPVATAIARSLAEGRSVLDSSYRGSRGPVAYLRALRELLPLLEEGHG